jgi:hypothetical protein
MKRFFKISITILTLFISISDFSQNLKIDELNKIRTSTIEEINRILTQKGWVYTETLKKGKLDTFAFLTEDKENPISFIVIGKEKHLTENGLVYYTHNTTYYLDLLTELEGKKINTVSKKNKTIDFYKNKNSIYGIKREINNNAKKFSIEVYSENDYTKMLQQLE